MNLHDYETLLLETSQFYNFSTIHLNTENLIRQRSKEKKKTCFLRHDIDFSPSNALVLAELEFKHNVTSTYTILISGQFYNPFEKETRRQLCSLKNLGHEVGLHFDPTIYEISSEDQLEHYIDREKKLLEDLIGHRVEMFSFHNTTEFSMSCRNSFYGGCQNAYSQVFQEEVEYTSDSNGYWRFRTWQELLLEQHEIIHILTHPIWWKRDNQLPPFETVVQNCLESFYKNISDYTILFDGQKVRSNFSLLSNMLIEMESYNNAKMLNAYAQFPKLLELLKKPATALVESDLNNMSKEFLEK